MALEIPESQEDAVKALFGLSKGERQDFLQAVRNLEPSLSRASIVEELDLAPSLDDKEISGIIQLLASVYLAYDDTDMDLEGFLQQLKGTFESNSERIGSPSPNRIEEISEFFAEALELHSSVGISAKALGLWWEQSSTYCRSRIVSDLRPVFTPQVSDPPAGFIVSHDFTITRHQENLRETQDLHISCTREDLLELKREIERALEKEETLVEAFSSDSIKPVRTAGIHGRH